MKKEVAVSEANCPVCGTGLSRRGLVLCQRCHSPHHRRCWSYNKGCGVYGCESRAFLLPALHDPVEGIDPRLVFRYRTIEPSDLFGAFWAVVFLVVLVWSPWTFPPLLGAVLGLLLLSVEHRADLEKGMLERRRLLGPLTIWRRREYLALEHLESLELRRRGAPGEGPWEVWARDASDRATLLEVIPTTRQEQALERVEYPAEQLDTVITLPRVTPGEVSLPPGLDTRLGELPEDDGF